MPWKLFLDDQAGEPGIADFRNPPDDSWTVAHSSAEAITLTIENGFPDEMDLDHDLGERNGVKDDAMIYLRWLLLEYAQPPIYQDGSFIAKWNVHSANGEGRKSIDAYLSSWNKVQEGANDDTGTSGRNRS